MGDKLKGILAQTTPEAQEFSEAMQNLVEPLFATKVRAPTIIAVEGLDFENFDPDWKSKLPGAKKENLEPKKESKSKKSKKRGRRFMWFVLGILAVIGIGFLANSSANSKEFRKSQ